MPSTSEKQRKYFGAVMSAKKMGLTKGKAAKTAKEMNMRQIKEFLVKKKK